MAYKLSTVLYGHVLDVRGLATTGDGHIVSASRDKTAKLWRPNRYTQNANSHVIVLNCYLYLIGCVFYDITIKFIISSY